MRKEPMPNHPTNENFDLVKEEETPSHMIAVHQFYNNQDIGFEERLEQLTEYYHMLFGHLEKEILSAEMTLDFLKGVLQRLPTPK